MAMYSAVCPHCQIKIGLKVTAVSDVRPNCVAIFMQCGDCLKPCSALAITQYGASSFHSSMGDSAKILNQLVNGAMTFYPPQAQTSAPEHAPPEVDRVFAQARDAHKRSAYDLAAMGYRRALELALKAKAPELQGQLGPRIDQLAAKHVLTAAMKDWAHDTRVLGNEANHDPPEPTQENVDQLYLFVESLIEYLFTLPERVRLRRAATNPPTGS